MRMLQIQAWPLLSNKKRTNQKQIKEKLMQEEFGFSALGVFPPFFLSNAFRVRLQW